MKEIILNDFCELIPFLLEKTSQEATDEFWFRGQKNKTWGLCPGAFRVDHEIEGQRLNRFKMYAPALNPHLPDLNDYRKWLPLMQHFGVPTRLLDWSTSPLIALFFAVNYSDSCEDAALFMFEPGKWIKTYYNVEYLYSIESTDDNFIKSLIKNAFQSKITENRPVPIYSSTNFQRSFIQQSVFTIHDSLLPMESYDKDNLIKKFIIPKEKIIEFNNIIKGLGISEVAIFSDLDTLGKWTKELRVIGRK